MFSTQPTSTIISNRLYRRYAHSDGACKSRTLPGLPHCCCLWRSRRPVLFRSSYCIDLQWWWGCWRGLELTDSRLAVMQIAELNLGFSKKEVIPSLPLKKGGSSLPSHKKRKERNQRACLTASFWSKMAPKTLADYRRHRDQEMNALDWLIYTTKNERSLLIRSFSGRDCTFTLSRRRKLPRWHAKSACISAFAREPARTKTRWLRERTDSCGIVHIPRSRLSTEIVAVTWPPR